MKSVFPGQVLCNKNNKIRNKFIESKKSFLNEVIKINLTEEEEKSSTSNKTNLDSFLDIEPYLNSMDKFTGIINRANPKFAKEFFLENVISKGSYGVIIKGGWKKDPKKKFAFKFILNKKLIQQAKEKKIKKISKEILIQNKLRHKNINKFFGYYDIADSFCYVLEHERHGDLTNFMKNIKRSSLSETLIGFMASQLLDALDYCHKSKIAHLDLKKENILVDENFNFKLCDYSVSLDYGDNSIRLNRVGSSFYMSPENLNDEIVENIDINKVDLYSLGVVIYNLAYKTYPFKLNELFRKDLESIRNKINNEKLEIPNGLGFSKLFRDFLQKILNKNISKRLSISEALNHPWIKATKIIFEEKEKFSDNMKFLVTMITDNVVAFNETLKAL
jgi:serine/threonine protein kinase